MEHSKNRCRKFNLKKKPPSSPDQRWTYLLQRRIRDAKAAQPHVCEHLLQLPKQAGIGSMFEAFVGEQIGQLLPDGLDQLGIGDVMVDECGDAVYIPWRKKTLQLWKQGFSIIIKSETRRKKHLKWFRCWDSGVNLSWKNLCGLES